MRQKAEGRIHERVTAIGSVAYPGYVIQGEGETVMIDAGLNWLGPRYLLALKEVLGEPERLGYLLLTHSHYDHVGAASYLKRHLPALKVSGHKRLADLLQKPSALELMNRLSDSHVELRREARAECDSDGDLSIQPLRLDRSLREGDELDLGDFDCRVYEVPGHTRDSLAFLFPEIGALFVGDACGVLEAGPERSVRVEFLSSYQEYLDSIERIASLRPKMLCLAHRWVLTGGDVGDFLELSAAETVRHRDLIERYLDAAGGDVERAIRELGHDEYDVKGGIRQERAAYMTNLAAQVRHIAGLRRSPD
jgi:glyoxylase-like metal-dependent hydrolase (beta-lactamase superfamily II)